VKSPRLARETTDVSVSYLSHLVFLPLTWFAPSSGRTVFGQPLRHKIYSQNKGGSALMVRAASPVSPFSRLTGDLQPCVAVNWGSSRVLPNIPTRQRLVLTIFPLDPLPHPPTPVFCSFTLSRPGLRARAPLPCPAYCAVATGQSGRTPCSEYNCSSTHAMVVTTLTLAELRHLARHGPKRIPATLSLAAACLSASSVQRCRKLCAPGAPTRQCRQPNKNGHVGPYHRTTSTR
jgi:hypothetical protein